MRSFSRRGPRVGFYALAFMVAGSFVQAATAQEVTSPAARPYQGMYAGGNPNPDQQLDLTWSMFTVRDDNVTADTRSFNPMYQVGGVYEDALLTLGYRTHRDSASFSANASANGRYYADLHELNDIGGRGDVNANFDFGRSKQSQTSLGLSQSFSYQPYYTLNLLGVGPSPPVGSGAATGNNALATQVSREYDGTAKLAKNWGAGSVFALSYDYRLTQLEGDSRPFLWQTANGAFTHKVTKYGALKLGYGYGTARDSFAGSPPTINQNIDVGIDYSRPLSSTRRTSFGFSSGSTIVTNLGVHYYRAIADATVTREIGRSWTAKGTYHRGVQYVEGIAGPLFADTGQLRVGGLLTKRLDLAINGAYSNGAIGLSAVNSGYVTYSGTAELRIALNRSLSLGAEYHYYRYDFDQGTLLPLGIPAVFRRQGFRIGVSGWSGLIH